MKRILKTAVTGFATFAFLGVPALSTVACDDGRDSDEAFEELKDEAGDAADDIEDEVDDAF